MGKVHEGEVRCVWKQYRREDVGINVGKHTKWVNRRGNVLPDRGKIVTQGTGTEVT